MPIPTGGVSNFALRPSRSLSNYMSVMPLKGLSCQSGSRSTAGDVSRRWSAQQILSRDVTWVAILVLLNLIFFSDVLFGGKTYFYRDVAFFHYPLKRLVTEAYANGEWPLWNPYIQLGQPLLANPNANAFYPTQSLYHIFPFELAFNLHFVLHCALAGIGTFYLSRTLGLTCFAAFLAALTYNFCGITISFVNLYNLLPFVALFPLLTLTFLKIRQRPSLFKLFCGSLLFGCFFQLLEPLCSLALGLFLFFFLAGLYLLSEKPRDSWGKALLQFGCSAVAGMLLASVQILPTWELIQHSGRRGGVTFAEASSWSLQPITLLQFLFARVIEQNFRLADATFWAQGLFTDREPYLISIYFGIFPLLLTLVGVILSRRRSLTSVLLLIAVITSLLALGKYTPLYAWLFDLCPLLRYGRYPVKCLLAANLCMCLLVGFGWDRIADMREAMQQRPASRNAGVRLFVACVILFWLALVALSFGVVQSWLGMQPSGLLLNYQGQRLQISPATFEAVLHHAQFMLGAFLVYLGLMQWRKIGAGIIQSVVACVLFLDFMTYNIEINPLVPVEFYEPAPASLYLQEQVKRHGLARIFPDHPEEGRDHFAILGKTDSVVWKAVFSKLRLVQFLSAKEHIHHSVFEAIDKLETQPISLILKEIRAQSTMDEQIRLLAKLNVGYLLSLREIHSPLLVLSQTFEVNSTVPLRIYQVTDALPRAFLANSDGSAMIGSPQNGWTACSKNSEDVHSDAKQARAASASSVRFIRYTPNHVELEASAEKACLLVLLDTDYPGWKAFIDGQETKISAVNSVFRGVNLAAGTHQIHFQYKPQSFRTGFWISMLTLCVWGALFVFKSAVDRRGGRESFSQLQDVLRTDTEV
ncbi:MAG: YfhO family protein [Acidobacteria bacterium]|nr:YfhO family protein [Acidobacteriota bacterium]